MSISWLAVSCNREKQMLLNQIALFGMHTGLQQKFPQRSCRLDSCSPQHSSMSISEGVRQEGRLLHTLLMHPSKLTVGAPILEANQAYNPGITCFFLLSCWHKFWDQGCPKIYTCETDKCQCLPLLFYRVWLCPSFMVLAIERMLWPYRKRLY